MNGRRLRSSGFRDVDDARTQIADLCDELYEFSGYFLDECDRIDPPLKAVPDKPKRRSRKKLPSNVILLDDFRERRVAQEPEPEPEPVA